MLHAKHFYVKNMLSKKLDDWSMTFTAGMCPAIIWLHDNFNRIHIRPFYTDAYNGVHLHGWPSMYKVNKALVALRKYAMEPAINGVSGQIDEKVTAIFYYTALRLKHLKSGGIHTGYCFSVKQYTIITKTLEVAQAGMETDHKARMRENASILDSLVDTLADANALRKKLKFNWENHLANADPNTFLNGVAKPTAETFRLRRERAKDK